MALNLVRSRLLDRVDEALKSRQQHDVARHALNRHDEERVQRLALALFVDLETVNHGWRGETDL